VSSSQPSSVMAAMDDIVGTLEEFLGTVVPVVDPASGLPLDSPGPEGTPDAEAAAVYGWLCFSIYSSTVPTMCQFKFAACVDVVLAHLLATYADTPTLFLSLPLCFFATPSALRGHVIATSLIVHIALARGTVTTLLRAVEALQGLGKVLLPVRHRVEDVWALRHSRDRHGAGHGAYPRHVLVCGQNGCVKRGCVGEWERGLGLRGL
jgi:hypothetical protein